MALEPDEFTWYGGNVEWRTYTCLECNEELHTPYNEPPAFCVYCGEPAKLDESHIQLGRDKSYTSTMTVEMKIEEPN